MSTPYNALPVADSTVAQTAPAYPYTPATPSAPETYVPPPPNVRINVFFFFGVGQVFISETVLNKLFLISNI